MPVLYDHREVRSGIPQALEDWGIATRPAQLPVGDYVVSDRLVVERKTGADLAASIKDRRLFEQIERLTEAYESVVLVVEGEPMHISMASWRGALGRALVAGVAVLQTWDPRETADWIARLRRLEEKGPSEARGRPRPRRPTDDLARLAEDVLGCLPGVSTVGARRLLEHFGSLAAVFAADATTLREVPGIGPVRAAGLAAIFAPTGVPYLHDVEEVPIRGEMIRLGQLLKLTGIVDTGGAIKTFLETEAVRVNGHPESRRGRQLRAGDIVEVPGRTLRVVAGGG